MSIVLLIAKVFGSLTIFLFGMKTMSDGLQKAAGERLQKTLNWMTKNRFIAVLTGVLITVLIQSSSATTVMVVSFANAGMLTLSQSIGVIMGANIGTTITAWLVTIANVMDKFSITELAIPILVFALPLFFSKRDKFKNIGEVIIGFSILFIGLDFMKDTMPDVKHNPEVQDWLNNFFASVTGTEGHIIWYGILAATAIGILLTALVQSSSAVTAIAITMVSQGYIPFEAAAGLVIGSNIGTTITAFLASLGANTTAKRASMAHVIFNVFGAILALSLFTPIIKLVHLITGTAYGAETIAPQAATIMVATFHTVFNIANTILLIGFTKYLAKLVEKIVPQKKGEISEKYELKYISTSMQDTPEINISHAKFEIRKMGDIILEMFNSFTNILQNPDKKMGEKVETIKKQEDYTDQMQMQINSFLSSCSKENLNAQSRENVNAMMRIVNEFESIADCCYNLVILTQKKYDKKLVFEDAARAELDPYMEKVTTFLQFTNKHLNEHLSKQELAEAEALEDEIDSTRNILKKQSRKRLQDNSNVRGELLYLDMVKQIEKIGDYALNIAQSLRIIR